MSVEKLRFAIFGNAFQAHKSASIPKILSFLYEKEAEIYIDREFYDFLTVEQHLHVKATKVFDGNDFDADFVISMGGDGTFLKAASHVGDKSIPIVGVNMGRLGFLADVRPDEIEQCLTSLYDGSYSVEEREVLQVSATGTPFDGCCCALNDIAILKRDNASMISIRTTINGEYLTTFQADGLIVSTPTGSTAYSLSNGGPIIVPGTKVFVLTAVAPHSLNARPIVVPDNSEIELTVESRSHNFLIAIDGRSEKCNEGTVLTLRKAPYAVRIVKSKARGYFHTLRGKMMWGADMRS
ncbi:MAG: NAD kinase [Prevotella sp.]|nr:NAD kinase [Prevotella sp.]